MHKIRSHGMPRGDVLPHRRPRGDDTSSIQISTPSTNQELVHKSKGPLPHRNGLGTPQTTPNRPSDPPGSHLDENFCEQSCPAIGPSLVRLTHMEASRAAIPHVGLL
jgi:hypothetical protein